MIKLWQQVLEPVMIAAGSKIILEIGAEYGSSTSTLLDFVAKNGGYLHSIDPAPGFDAEKFEKENSAHVTIYRDLSLNAIPSIPIFDAALIDGDHNWYTVYNELLAIERLHGHNALGQPLIFVHDTEWPYGRRDLYYDPETIPQQYRLPYSKGGILPNSSELDPVNGINTHLDNAHREGGEHNGVMAGVEDYLSETKLNFRTFHLPCYHGLTILLTEDRLATDEALAKCMEQLFSSQSLLNLLERMEKIRCTDLTLLQTAVRNLRHELQTTKSLLTKIVPEKSEPKKSPAKK